MHALKVAIKGQNSATIQQLIDDRQTTVLLTSIPVDTVVTSASAMVGRVGPSHLIHVGDSVKYAMRPEEVRKCNTLFLYIT